jgi:hypothetical protein
VPLPRPVQLTVALNTTFYNDVQISGKIPVADSTRVRCIPFGCSHREAARLAASISVLLPRQHRLGLKRSATDHRWPVKSVSSSSRI